MSFGVFLFRFDEWRRCRGYRGGVFLELDIIFIFWSFFNWVVLKFVRSFGIKGVGSRLWGFREEGGYVVIIGG